MFTDVNITEDKEYTVEGTTEGCTSYETFKITVLNLPNVKINDGKDTAICEGESIVLRATGAKSFEWLDMYNETDSEITKEPKEITMYAVKGIDDNNCVNSDTIIVNVNKLPNIELEYINSVCDGSNVVITALNNDIKYQWSAQSDYEENSSHTIENIINDITGEVFGMDKNNCVNKAPYEIKRKPNPQLTLTGEDVCYNNKATIVSLEEFSSNDYNLSVNRYKDVTDLNVVDAKRLLDNLPCLVKTNLEVEEEDRASSVQIKNIIKYIESARLSELKEYKFYALDKRTSTI